MRYIISLCACLFMSVIANIITSSDAFLEMIVNMLIDGTPHFIVALIGLLPLMALNGLAVIIIKAINYADDEINSAAACINFAFMFYIIGMMQVLEAGEVTGVSLGIGLVGFVINMITLALCMKKEQ